MLSNSLPKTTITLSEFLAVGLMKDHYAETAKGEIGSLAK